MEPRTGKRFWVLDNLCKKTFYEKGKLDIDEYNGVYVAKTDFDQNTTSIKYLEKQEITFYKTKYTGIYHGMVNE